MFLSVISQLPGATVELSVVVKIHKYRRLQEGHHFILMAIEVHLNVIWIVPSGSVFIFLTIND